MDELTLRRLNAASGSEGTWSTAGCVLSVTADGTIGWAAQSAGELGWSAEDLVGRHVSALVPGLPDVLGSAERARILQAGEDGATVVEVGVRQDGQRFEAAVTLAAKRSATGEVTGLTVVVRDVTDELGQRRTRRLAHDREAVLILGRDLAVRYATPPAAALLGLHPGDLFPGPAEGLLHSADRVAVAEAVDRMLADPGRVERLVPRLRGDGPWRAVELTLSSRLDDPDILGLVALLRDVTERVTVQDEARLSAALHRARVETSEEGIVVTGDDGATRYVNLATAGILGVGVDELYDVDLTTLLGSRAGAGREEIVYAHPDGFDRILAVTRSPLGDDRAGLGSLLTVTDVTESRLSERDLRRRALYDPLTGLPNRYLVRDRLDMAASRRARSGDGSTAVLFIDLDGLKPVNDTHGHDAGDELLRQVAERLTTAVRTTDTVGRVGGDEFVIICEGVEEDTPTYVAARVMAALSEPFQLAQTTVRTTASIGIALSPPFPVELLVQEADAAMYRAKRAGGGDVVIARP